MNDTLEPRLFANTPEASEAQQREFHTHLHQTLNAPSHPIRNRLLRLTADSPDLLAVIKEEGRVGLVNSALFNSETKDFIEHKT